MGLSYLQVSWVLFADTATPGQIEKLDSGMVRVRGRVARTGVQEYAPWPGAPITDRAIRVFRPPTEVFADSSLKTLKGVPVTIGHPPERSVDAKNWKRYAVGHNEGESKRVSDSGEEFIESTLMIADAEAVARIIDKDLVEISQGYSVELDWTAGVTDSGESYDARQTQITHNHTALLGVGDARAGKGARVLVDSNEDNKRMTKELFKKKLGEQLKAVDAKIRTGVGSFVSETITPMLDEMSEEEVAKLIEYAVKAAVSKMQAPEEEKPADEEEDPKKEEEEKPTDEEEDPKEKEKVGDAKERAKGADLVKKFADSESRTLSILDAREEAREMLPEGYDFKGKSAKQIRLDSIKEKRPELYKSLVDASDDRVLGAFEALKSNRAAWVVKDSKPAEKDEHKTKYEKRMSDAFEKSWGAN